MASIHRQENRPYWFCRYTTADGKRHNKSTKTTNRAQAQVICSKWELAAKKAKSGRLTPDAARHVIAQGVSEIFAGSDGDSLPRATVNEWATKWLESKAIESAPATLARYQGTIEKFIKFLGPVADKDLEHVSSTHIEGFRNKEAKRLTASSANTALKVIRALFSGALGKQLISRNPASASFVKTIDRKGEASRRPLTLEEVKKVLRAAEDVEWRGMILMGLYTGQRLGDISKLTWSAVNFKDGHISFSTQKTGKRIIIPLNHVLRSHLQGLTVSKSPKSSIFPIASQAKKTGHLSNGFHSILVNAGLAAARNANHASTGKGRSAKREVSELSFHSLRHNTVTMLKAAGVSDAVTREIVGHDSAAVNRNYTHLDTESLRPAIDNLPDITT